MINDYPTAGASEKTPSVPQYFSWLNSTNEGSTESQTLANLEYFAYLKRKYNMLLKIYAWDAGNLDGANQTYQTPESPKIKKQYPRGYAPVAQKAAEIGCRLGIWCGPDGFGDTEEEHAARHELMVSLCRDLHFAEFKIDGVCGQLSEEHRDLFVKMMSECRKYSPDLILLNHRLWLGREGMKHATTFLWNGGETYVDVFICNKRTAPHHRAFLQDRGNVEGLLRLCEDHGVCISSCVDYFEDDLIIQAFGRCLILAPEIYGNPWLLRDDEQARLARIYNLHRRFANILVYGMLLPGGTYPPASVVRGDEKRRFISASNQTWDASVMNIDLDMSIGLSPCDKVCVIVHHPYEKIVGVFDYGDACPVELEPFRACLVEVVDKNHADIMLRGCEYEVLHEDENGRVDEIKIVSSTGAISYTDGTPFCTTPVFDNTLRAPLKLGEADAATFADVPADAEKQLETALFAQDHDSLEARSLKRSGKTDIPEVQAARDAFFGQKTYKLRGCEGRFAFDNDPDTFFDGVSRTFFGGLRVDGGCLRVDFGDVYDADSVKIEFFDPCGEYTYTYKNGIDTYTVPKQTVPSRGDHSTELSDWQKTYLESIENGPVSREEYLIHSTHDTVLIEGRRRTATYPVQGKLRYMRLPEPPDRIVKISLLKDGKELELKAPRVNNLLPYKRSVKYVKQMTVTVNGSDLREGCYIAVGLEGEHGAEAAYAVLDVNGEYRGAYDRACSYQSNVWECIADAARNQSSYYTYYFDVDKDMCDVPVTVRIIGLDEKYKNYSVTAYLCDKNRPSDGIIKKL